MTLPDASAEKPLAAVTAGGAVVLSRGLVPTDGTVGHHSIVPIADAGLRWHAFCRSHSKHTTFPFKALGYKVWHGCRSLD